MKERRSYKQIMSRDLPELLAQGGRMVDVRLPDEWRLTGIVNGSVPLTFYDENGNCHPQEWIAKLDRIVGLDQPLILICRTGHRTVLICEMLIEMTSRSTIYNVTDGIFGWIAAGFPVESVTEDS